MTTEGQGRAADPVGFGIPVVIDGPWAEPRIYPDMAGMLDNPDAAYAKLKEMGKGLFGPRRGSATDLADRSDWARRIARRQPTAPAAAAASDPLGGKLGETLGNLLQQGLGQSRTIGRNRGHARDDAGSGPPRPRRRRRRAIRRRRRPRTASR